MNRLCTRRRQWTTVSAWVAVVSSIAAAATGLWTVLLAPTERAAINGVVVLIIWAAVAVSSAVVTAVLRVTESPGLIALLSMVNGAVKPDLRLVNSDKAHTGG